MRKFFIAFIVAFAAALPAAAQTEDYPNKPIRFVIPFPPGGGTDLAGRLAADFLTQRLGQSVVVENKPGAGSTIGIDFVAKAKPDGYTIAWGASDSISMIPALRKSMPYRVPEDLEFVASVARTSGIAVSVNPKLPFATIADLIAYAKANPNKLRYASFGVGTSGHLGAALLSKTSGIEMIHVPYQGTAAAVNATVGGHVDLVFAGTSTVRAYHQAGTLRMIGTFEMRRNPAAPEIPTFEESGMPGVNAVNYYGVFAPVGTPKPILARLEKELAEFSKDPKITERLRGLGIETGFYTGAEYREMMVKDLAKWRDLGQTANIVLE